jgi:hypothetical protein
MAFRRKSPPSSEFDPATELAASRVLSLLCLCRYFWSAVAGFSPTDQRRLLAFITASDRLPATGITSLELKLQCLGDDSDRYPQSHTCFNTLSLYRYSSLQKMERMLRRSFEDRCGPFSAAADFQNAAKIDSFFGGAARASDSDECRC